MGATAALIDWRPPLVQVLRDGYLAGKTGVTIAREVQALAGRPVTREAVVGKLKRLGISEPRNPERSAQMFRLSKGVVQLYQADRFVCVPTKKPAKHLKARQADRHSKTLVDRGDGCKFPVGEASGADQLFCARPRDAKASYCGRCERWAYKPRTPC